MATLAVQTIIPAGVAPAFAAASAGGDKVAPGADVFLEVKNAGGAAVTVTVTDIEKCSRGSTHDLVVSVPATTGDRMIGPITSRYGNSADGNLAAITYTATASVTVAALRLPRG